MKTLILSILFAASLQPSSGQDILASVEGTPSFQYNSSNEELSKSAEPAVTALSHTVDDAAYISLGKGFRQPVQLQVLTPSTKVLINQEIPAGQTRVKIDLSGMENGTYTVRIRAGEKTWVRQVLKG